MAITPYLRRYVFVWAAVLCIRALLYMCALQARKCNPTCKALFDRLCAKGKPYRVALIAVANKLLKQVFAIAKSGQPFRLPLEAV